jgi:hypothetical protein
MTDLLSLLDQPYDKSGENTVVGRIAGCPRLQQLPVSTAALMRPLPALSTHMPSSRTTGGVEVLGPFDDGCGKTASSFYQNWCKTLADFRETTGP